MHFAISQKNHNVLNCDDDKLILDSRKEHLKIVDSGEIDFTLSVGGGGYEEKAHNHNLGYIPLHYVFFKSPVGITTRRIIQEDERSVYEATFTCGAYATSSQLIFWANVIPDEYIGEVINFKYFIFANKIT